MSRGEGLLQRRILRLVEKAARRGDGSLTRRELEDHLEPEGYRSDNLLRALRGLSRANLVSYREARFPGNCTIGPPKPFTPFSDEEILALLLEPGWKEVPDAPIRRKYTPRTPRVSEEKSKVRVEAGPEGA